MRMLRCCLNIFERSGALQKRTGNHGDTFDVRYFKIYQYYHLPPLRKSLSRSLLKLDMTTTFSIVLYESRLRRTSMARHSKQACRLTPITITRREFVLLVCWTSQSANFASVGIWKPQKATIVSIIESQI